MWIFLPFGAFFPAQRPADTIQPGDPATLQIRARRKEHLDRLRTYYMPGDLGPTYEIAYSDYEYRANCAPAAWASALVKITMEIDYVSFKDTTISKWNDHPLHAAYLKVWSVVNRALAPPAHTTAKPHTYQPGRDRRHGSRLPVNRPYNPADPLAWVDDLDRPAWWDSDPTDEEIAGQATLDECRHESWEENGNWRRCADCGYGWPATFTATAARSERIDHSECSHAPTNAARKRCRRRREQA